MGEVDTFIKNARAEVDAAIARGKPGIDAQDEYGSTALMRAAGTTLWQYGKKGTAAWIDNIRRLLEAGAKIDLEDKESCRAMHSVVGASPTEGLKLLLEHGADPNLPLDRTFGMTPLHAAVEQGRTAKVRLLLEYGADLNAAMKLHGTALDMAKRADIKELLKLAKAGKLKAATRTPAAPKRAEPPKELVEFLAKQAPKLTGRLAYGLPSYGKTAGVGVRFLKAPSLKLFSDNGVDPLEHPSLHPLAKLDGEAQFLVVDGSKKGLPVAMWEHETGEFEKVAPTLAKFAAGLKRK